MLPSLQTTNNRLQLSLLGLHRHSIPWSHSSHLWRNLVFPLRRQHNYTSGQELWLVEERCWNFQNCRLLFELDKILSWLKSERFRLVRYNFIRHSFFIFCHFSVIFCKSSRLHRQKLASCSKSATGLSPCYHQADIRMRSHRLLWLDDNSLLRRQLKWQKTWPKSKQNCDIYNVLKRFSFWPSIIERMEIGAS